MAVGAAGVAVAAAAVVMFAGFDAKFVAVKVNGPPNDPIVIFCKASVAGLGALVKVQTIFEKSFKLTAGIVMTLPAKVPKLAGLPVVPELVSVQVPLDKLKLVLAASVKVTGLALLVTVLLIGATGAAVPAVTVVIFGGTPVKFVAVKLNGPPGNAVVIFWMATTGIAGLTVLVKVQVICALTRTLAAGTVSTVPASVPKLPAGLPEAAAFASVQLAAVRVKLATAGSVIVTAVPVALAKMGAATAG